MALTPVDAHRRYQDVARQIAALIAAGDVAPGARLPAERDLAGSLNVSRSTVREAMIALEIAGLVEVRTGAGVFVARAALRVADVVTDVGAGPLELIDARTMLEPTLAARAAEALGRAPDAPEAQALRDAMAAMETAGDAAAHYQADRAFHHAIARAAGNSVAASIVDALWREMFSPLFDRMRALSGLLPFEDAATAPDHRVILDAVLAGDAPGARAAMRAHLGHVRGKLLSLRPPAARVDAAE